MPSWWRDAEELPRPASRRGCRQRLGQTQMAAAAEKQLDFELAARLRDRLRALTYIEG